jgi:hypothetical protein
MNKDQNENLVIKKLRKTISEEKENTTRKTYGSDDGSPCRTSADDDIAPETSETIPKITLPKAKQNTALTDRDARARTSETNKTHTLVSGTLLAALRFAMLCFSSFFLLKIN